MITGYLINFTVYTSAMIGILFIGFIIAKKSLSINDGQSRKNKFLTVESSLSLEPRKNLYVVKAGSERFLISTDAEGSHFLTRLETNNFPVYENNEPEKNLNMSIPALSSGHILKSKLVEKLSLYITNIRGN